MSNGQSSNSSVMQGPRLCSVLAELTTANLDYS